MQISEPQGANFVDRTQGCRQRAVALLAALDFEEAPAVARTALGKPSAAGVGIGCQPSKIGVSMAMVAMVDDLMESCVNLDGL